MGGVGVDPQRVAWPRLEWMRMGGTSERTKGAVRRPSGKDLRW